MVDSGVQSLPCQSMRCAGASPISSHQTSPSSVSATLVNRVLPGSRYCVPISQCPTAAPEFDDWKGVSGDDFLSTTLGQTLASRVGENLPGTRFGNEFFISKAIGWALRDLC